MKIMPVGDTQLGYDIWLQGRPRGRAGKGAGVAKCAGHMVSVTATHLYHSSMKQATDRSKQRTVAGSQRHFNSCSVQFCSVAESCPTLCDPMNCSMPGLPVHHQLPEFAQTHVHPVGDAIQPSHPLSSPSPPAPSPSQLQGLFQ